MGDAVSTQLHFRPGSREALEASSPSRPWMSVFEEDGETGYFYALDRERWHGNRIVDAIQIYTMREDYGRR